MRELREKDELSHRTASNSVGDASLASALQALSRRDSQIELKVDRESAARILLDEMKHWAPSVIWNALGAQLKGLSRADVETLIEDAVQGLALVASTSSSPFRGDNEAAARAWCRRVLMSHVVDELRLRRAEQSAEPLTPPPDSASDALDDAEPSSDPQRARFHENLSHAVELLRAIRTHVYRARRRRDAEGTLRAVWCYLDYLSGATLEEQVQALTETEDGAAVPGTDARRSRNRIYKLRERGHRALHEVRTQMSSGSGHEGEPR